VNALYGNETNSTVFTFKSATYAWDETSTYSSVYTELGSQDPSTAYVGPSANMSIPNGYIGSLTVDLTSVIQYAVNNAGTVTGIAIYTNNSGYEAWIASHDNTTASLRPVLSVTYH